MKNPLNHFAEECIRCRVCLNICTLLHDLGITPGEIAQKVLNGQASDDLLAAIQRCDLCGQCSQDCQVHLNPADLLKAARETLVQTGRINPNDYDVMRVDRKWNFFTIYRDTHAICYTDLWVEKYEVLFFPGCTLAAYAPELTRAAFNWLKGNGVQPGFSELCCGKPLDSLGLSDAAEHHLECLRSQLAAAGARRIITACPNCEAHLRASRLDGIEIISIYSLLVAAGIRLAGETRLTFHDSCPDRYGSSNPHNIRQLLSGYQPIEMDSRGENSLCCGSGGIVSMIDPELCTARAGRRMAEFYASGADICITTCMACAHRLARASQPGEVRHILEYVFALPVDYAQVERNAHAMWEGSKGEINLLRLAQSSEAGPERGDE